MAATGDAIGKLTKSLKRTGELCQKSFEILSNSVWSENDFSNILFTLNRYPNPHLSNLFMSKITQSDVTKYSSFPQILRFAAGKHWKSSHNVFARWGTALAESGNFHMMYVLMMKVSLPPMVLGELDRKLKELEIKEKTTILANLTISLARSRFQFSPQSYENIFRSASTLWFPSRELSFILYNIHQSTLPKEKIIGYLEHFSGQVESKALIMSPQDRARLLFAYTAKWTKVSEKIVGLVIREADYENLLDENIGVILRALSQHPTFDDDFLFSQIESRIYTSANLHRYWICNLITAYTNRQYASPKLYALLKKEAFRTYSNLANYFMLMKHPCCTKEDRELYEFEIKQGMRMESVMNNTKSTFTELGETSTAKDFEAFIQALKS